MLLIQGCFAQIQFVENKGQWDEKIAFRGELNSGSFVVKKDGGYRIILMHPEDIRTITNQLHGIFKSGIKINNKLNKLEPTAKIVITKVRSHAYEMIFENSNPTPQAIPDKPLQSSSNYFIGSDPAKWKENCKMYGGITFKDIYPKIDVRYYTNNGQLKYDIIVNPGGNPNDIVMHYDGVNDLSLKKGALIIKTSVGEMKEGSPFTFQPGETSRNEIPCVYKLKGNEISFKLKDSYNHQQTLVIDPTMVFGSFSGSKADNWGYTATYDATGNFYAGGIVFGSGYPVTNGAFQTVFAGGNNGTGEGQSGNGQSVDINGFDMGIMKFDPTGTKVLYATYIGGSKGNEQPHSLVVDPNGNLVIAGRTTSSDYPQKNPATGSTTNLVGPGGGQDIVLTKLNSTGGMIGSMIIGGSGDDGVNIRSKDMPGGGTVSTRRNYGDDARSEVVLDKAGNIYLGSCSQSSNFPMVNAFQSSNNGAANNGSTLFHQNAVIIKAAPDLSSIIFSSYLGGSGNDAAFAIALSPLNGNIYLAGATSSTNFPFATNAFMGGACDGFISIINNSSNPSIISSKYIGTSSADQLYGIQFNKTGANVFISGTTEGLMPVVASPFNTNEGQANGKQFITKLTADLTTVVYSVNFGNNGSPYPNISPAAFLVDICENVYVSGWGGGLDRYVSTPGLYQSDGQGNLISGGYSNTGTQGMVAKAAPDHTQPLNTSTDGNGFYFFVLEKNANSQLYGGFFGDRQMTQNGSFQGDYNGVHVDGGTSRFDANGTVYQSICACGPDPNMSTKNVPYPNNGAYQSVQNNNNVGGFSCNLFALKIAFNLSGVNTSIVAAINGRFDTVGCVPINIIFTDTIAKGKTYIWIYGDGTVDTTTVPTSSHLYNNVGKYRVKLISIDSSTCNISDSVFANIKVGNNIITPNFGSVKLGGCQSFTYQFTNTTTAIKPVYQDTSFVWNFGDGSAPDTTGYAPITHTFPTFGTYFVTMKVIDTAFCNEPDSITFAIRISNNVKAGFTTFAQGCVPYTATFKNTSIGGTNFNWSFGDGGTDTAYSPTHTFTSVGTYNVQLISTDLSTCNKHDTFTYKINVVGIPTADFSYSPIPAKKNTPTQFINQSTNAVNYIWDFGDGSKSTLSNPIHQYNKTDTFTVCLQAINAAGCIDSVCKPVPAIVQPLLDIPNAFTPGKNGIDAIIKVVGFGISKMDWKIYNRWGQLVFESTDPNIGWDGTFHGQLQPMDVYTYTLDAEFINNKPVHKTGDITLIK